MKRAVADVADPGNCAEWISGALVAAGILRARRALPRSIATDLLYEYGRERLTIVQFERATHAQKHPINDGYLLDDVAPVHSWLAIRGNTCHTFLDRLADLVVRVPEGTNVAHLWEVKEEERAVHEWEGGKGSVRGRLLRLEPEGSMLIPFLHALALGTTPSLFHSALLGLALIMTTAVASRRNFVIDLFFLHLALVPFALIARTVVSLVGPTIGLGGGWSEGVIVAVVAAALWRRVAYGFV
jgi:hypothetical protein